MAVKIAPATRLKNPSLIFCQSIGRFSQTQGRAAQTQRPATVTNPVVRILLRQRAVCAKTAVAMAAGIAIGVVGRARSAQRLCPGLFCRTGFDQKMTRVVRASVLLRDPLDQPVLHIDGIKSHVAFFLWSYRAAIDVSPRNLRLRRLDHNDCLRLNRLEMNC